ncbi:MAG: ABC transporter permease, partial [Trueperaceae bacterium]
PAFALGTSIMALITRLTRSSLLEVLNRDYVRTARAKGLRGIQVVYGHALKNALLPVITVVGVQFGALLGGAIVIEVVFSWPGVGRLIVNGISQRDFPVVQGSVLMLAAVFALVNLLVDLSYSLVNPRIRYG